VKQYPILICIGEWSLASKTTACFLGVVECLYACDCVSCLPFWLFASSVSKTAQDCKRKHWPARHSLICNHGRKFSNTQVIFSAICHELGWNIGWRSTDMNHQTQCEYTVRTVWNQSISTEAPRSHSLRSLAKGAHGSYLVWSSDSFQYHLKCHSHTYLRDQ
jgi:hypothetical protein